MFAGAALLTVMAFASVLDRRTWWSYPNLLAATFYGPRAIGTGFGWPTISGVALQLLIAACAGAVFGTLFGGVSGSGRIALLAVLWGLLLFYASEQFFSVTNVFVLAYLPRKAAILAHMTYGLCLTVIGRMTSTARRATVVSVLEPGVPESSREHASTTQALHKDADSTGRESTL